MTGFDIHEILRRLPHRYPFLLVDRVVELEPRQRIVALKNVTVNEPYFTGHFPGDPIVPGVLMVETIAQVCGLLAEADETRDVFLVGIDGFRFRQPVRPGDQLRVEAMVLKHMKDIYKFKGTITVEGKVVAEGEILAAITQKEAVAP